MKARITVIEDDDDLRNLIALSLRADGYDVKTQADSYAMADTSDLYIVDLDLGSESGLDICKRIKTQQSYNPIVLFIYSNPELRHLALEACADDTLQKPFTSRDMLDKLSKLLTEPTVEIEASAA
jgi:DNA-binding response OmpR family regulator